MMRFAGRLLNQNLSDVLPGTVPSGGLQYFEVLPDQNLVRQMTRKRIIPDSELYSNYKPTVERYPTLEYLDPMDKYGNRLRNPIGQDIVYDTEISDQMTYVPGSGFVRTYDDILF